MSDENSKDFWSDPEKNIAVFIPLEIVGTLLTAAALAAGKAYLRKKLGTTAIHKFSITGESVKCIKKTEDYFSKKTITEVSKESTLKQELVTGEENNVVGAATYSKVRTSETDLTKEKRTVTVNKDYLLQDTKTELQIVG